MTKAPSLDNAAIDLIRDSFVQVLFARDEAARIFYAHLFAIAPETRALFRDDLTEQGRVLIATLASIVAGLNRLEESAPTIRALGQRHVAYGVLPSHYPAVGAALLHMVTVTGGGTLHPATEVAWRTAYRTIAALMIGEPDA